MSFQQRSDFGAIPQIVKNLLIINILMFLATAVVEHKFGIDLNRKLGLFFIKSPNFEPYQYISYMFMHANLSHLFFNMFALWMFGRVIENVWGGKKFFIYYMVTGIGAAIIQTLVNLYAYSGVMESATAFFNTPTPELFSEIILAHLDNPSEYVINVKEQWFMESQNSIYRDNAIEIVKQITILPLMTPTVGASGAVFGILLAFGMLFPNAELMLLFLPIPIKAKYFVLIYGVVELFAGVANFNGDNIAHFAHLGGMIFGFILIKYWGKGNDTTMYQ